MSKKKFAKSTEEFDRRFDEGEDIHDIVDMNQARIIRHGKKVRITLDVAEELVQDIDQKKYRCRSVRLNQNMVTRKGTAGKR